VGIGRVLGIPLVVIMRDENRQMLCFVNTHSLLSSPLVYVTRGVLLVLLDARGRDMAMYNQPGTRGHSR